MKLKPGDRVKFLNDVGEGVLIRLIDERMGEVEIEDGFRVPVLLSELIRAGADELGTERDAEDDFPVMEENLAKPEKEVPEGIQTHMLDGSVFPPAIMLALVRERSDQISLCLVNDSPYYLYYTLAAKQGNTLLPLHDGKLEPETKVVAAVRTIRYFESQPVIHGQVLLFHPAAGIPEISPMEARVDTKDMAKQFDECPAENDYFDQKALIQPFTRVEMKAKPVTLSLEELRERLGTERPPGAETKQKPLSGSVLEVDLHIELLVVDPETLSPAEILDIQLGKFRNMLDDGIAKKAAKIVFIHGIGNGKLKHEIRRIIDSEYPRLRYQDASFREYGYGATLVIIPAK